MTCVISSVESDPAIKPILASFQNGILEDCAVSELEAKLLTNGKRMAVFAKSKSMLYKGDATQNDLTNDFVVIVNRKTKKARFVAVDSCSFAPVLASDNTENLNTSNKENNWNASSIMLNKTFGSKRAQRAGLQMERLTQEVSQFKDDLEKTVRETEIEETHAPEIVGSYNPPINKAAKVVEDVYDIHNIVAKDILDTLKASGKSLLKEGPEKILTSQLAVKLLDKVQSSPASSKSNYKKCRILILLDTLMKLLNAKYNAIATKSFRVCSLSDRVNQYALDTFTVNTVKGRTRPMSMKDKTICYVIVLALLINDYSINLNELSEAFGIAKRRLQDFCKILSLTMNKNKVDADLILPLPQNVMKVMLPKKRKR